MSKFIKVQLESNNKWALLNTDEIFEISKNNDGYTKIAMKGATYTVHQSVEQIEAQLLRDEFAKAALTGFCSDDEMTTGASIRISYDYADAMLKERNK